MVFLGVSSPLRKSPPHMSFPPTFLSQCFPPVSSYCRSNKIVKGGTNYTKFPLSSAEEKHADTYMVMSNTRNKTLEVVIEVEIEVLLEIEVS